MHENDFRTNFLRVQNTKVRVQDWFRDLKILRILNLGNQRIVAKIVNFVVPCK